MKHDADYIDAQEFMQMRYEHCLLYLMLFYEQESDCLGYFSTDGALEDDNLKDEFEDKMVAMANRGYLNHLSDHYPLYSFTSKAEQIIKNLESCQN